MGDGTEKYQGFESSCIRLGSSAVIFVRSVVVLDIVNNKVSCNFITL